MFHIILFQPEIPPNTGNIIRLSANTGIHLHLIHPMGFNLSEKQVRRAGLDYHQLSRVKEYNNLEECLSYLNPSQLFACSTKGKKNYTEVKYSPNAAFLFGPETRGLPLSILKNFSAENILRIPMISTSRSLNLSNAVAIITYEAWRQINFVGSDIEKI